MPLFVLDAAWAAAVYASTVPRQWVPVTGSAILIAGLPWAVSAHNRPLIPLSGDPVSVLTSDRSSQYFVTQPALLSAFQDAATVIASSGCHDVGSMGMETS